MNGNEVGELVEELKEQIQRLPENRKSIEKKLKEESNKQTRLYELGPKVERIQKIRTQLLPAFDGTIKSIEAELKQEQGKHKQFEQDIKGPKEKMELISQITGDMSLLDDAIKDLEVSQSELTRLKQRLPEAQNDMSLEDLQNKRKELSDKVKVLDRETNSKEDRLDKDRETIQKLQDKEIQMKQESMKLREQVTQLNVLKANETKLNADIEKLHEQKQKRKDDLVPVQAKRKQAEQQRQKIKEENARKLQNAQGRMDMLKSLYADIERHTGQLEKLAALKLDDQIDRCEKIIGELREKEKQKVCYFTIKHLQMLTAYNFLLYSFYFRN